MENDRTSEPGSSVETELAGFLDELFYDRGNHITEWPEDEAEAYREFGWAEGRRAARNLVARKAAQAVMEWFTVRFPEVNLADIPETPTEETTKLQEQIIQKLKAGTYETKPRRTLTADETVIEILKYLDEDKGAYVPDLYEILQRYRPFIQKLKADTHETKPRRNLTADETITEILKYLDEDKGAYVPDLYEILQRYRG